MNSLGIIIWLTLFGPVELDRDTYETNLRHGIQPLALSTEAWKKCERIRVFVSHDLGKTWKLQLELAAIAEMEFKAVVADKDSPLAKERSIRPRPFLRSLDSYMDMPFCAPQDGHYWYAAQIVYKDGSFAPAKIDETNVNAKIFVNSLRRPILRK